jgi:glutamyl-tRNA synthetase
LADLAAIGLDWDGEVLVQSGRSAFCTRAEIRESVSAAHGPVGLYPGTCLGLTDDQREARRAAGRAPALRVRAGGARVDFVDRLLGAQTSVVDDFVVRRNDGAYAYNLAVVVDDAAQGIEEVVRGADLADSTARQIWLAGALGAAAPAYAHVPLVLGKDGQRLAKRHGSVTLRDVPVDTAVAWMGSSLGLRGRTAAAMLDGFDPSALPREPTIYAG